MPVNGPQPRPPNDDTRPPRPQLYAALDLGTNNCRLLIAQPEAGGFRVVESFSRIVRLGEGIGVTGKLSPGAIDRAIEALRICAERLGKYRGIRLRAVATEACRRASNGAEFVARVRNETDLPLTVIGPEEEARLALAGCASLLDDSTAHALVFDIGGGSTELIWKEDFGKRGGGANGSPPARPGAGRRGRERSDRLRYHSVPIGVVTMAERYGSNRISDADYDAMVDEACGLLQPFERNEAIRRAIAERQVQMIGTSGTVTTLASVNLKLKRYSRLKVDGTYLDFDAIRAISDSIARLDYDQRAAIPCIGPQRADLVVGGIAILDAICRLWPVGRLRVADRGLREGILNELMAQGERRRDPAA